MITKFNPGDSVVAKNSYGTYKKGKIERVWYRPQGQGYYVHFEDDTWRFCEAYIIKVDSDFNMSCNNCKHFDKTINEVPCNNCLLGHQHCNWEPGNSLKNKDKLIGNDIKAFSIDEGPFTDKKVNYSYISTNRCNTANMLERQMYERLLASPLKIEKLDMESFYPNPKPVHLDDIDALRYYMDSVRVRAEFMADFNKKENKNMKKQQKKRDRNIIKVKDLETRKIKEVMFNGPATIIKWDPTWHQLAYNEAADKTVTVAKEPDKFDKTTGFLLAVLKELVDNQSYGNILEKIDEINKFDEEDLKPKYNDEAYKYDNKTELHCSIKDLTEETEALENVYVPGSVVKYKNGKKYYKVLCYRFDGQLKELVYVLRPYKGTCFTDNNLEGTCKSKRNIPHSKLIRVRRK